MKKIMGKSMNKIHEDEVVRTKWEKERR